MVFIAGPRQVGKTWLSREVAKCFTNSLYLNYDNFSDREIILREQWLPETDLLILDELHKMKDWQSFLKGIYDTKKTSLRILVTGSARMDILSHSGESLAGRYFHHRLLPLSLKELKGTEFEGKSEQLLSRGGFPEPFIAASEIDVSRWRYQYLDGLLRYDVLDFQRIVDFKALQLTVELIRKRVGSPLSVASIARDIGTSPTTIAKYVHLLEGLFLIFRVTPYSRNIARSIMKEPKVYFYDTGLVTGDEDAKFENFVAVSLLKDLWGRIDYLGENWQLHYLRTKEGQETDFAIVKDEQIDHIIECKVSDGRPDKNLQYFANKYSIKALQLVRNTRNNHVVNGISVINADTYLSDLFL